MSWELGYDDGEMQAFLAGRHARQPYSVVMVGSNPLVVMWDSCCTLKGLMKEEKAEKLREKCPGQVKAWRQLLVPRAVGGITSGQAAHANHPNATRIQPSRSAGRADRSRPLTPSRRSGDLPEAAQVHLVQVVQLVARPGMCV